MSEQTTIAVFAFSFFTEVLAHFVLLSDNNGGGRSRCRRYDWGLTCSSNRRRRLWFSHNLLRWCVFLDLFQLWLGLLHDVFALMRIVGLLFMVHSASFLGPVFSVATILDILLPVAVKVIWRDWVYVKLCHIEISNLSIWWTAWVGGIWVLVIKVGEGIEVCSRGKCTVFRHICD